MKYFIPQLLLDKQAIKGINNFYKEDYINLYNKNSNNWSYWKIIKRNNIKYGWIVERYNCPKYWKAVIDFIPRKENRIKITKVKKL